MSEGARSRLTALFQQAIVTPASGRDAFVDDACGDDIRLREELRALLTAHDAAVSHASPGLDGLTGGTAGSRGFRRRVQEALGDTYVIDSELTGGGMSRVFLADEAALHRKVVVKVLPQEMSLGVGVQRFRREIELAAQLQHPHIVPLLAANSAGGLLYYTMPFVAGETLRARIAREGALPVKDAVAIWHDVLEALACAHAAGIVHRDIKPGNVLLSGRTAVVTDFGIAKALGDARAADGTDTLTQGGGIGTPSYMAPEQIAGGGDSDHRIDIYAAGLLLYEMLAGRSPFAGLPIPEMLVAHLSRRPAGLSRSDVPPALEALLLQCLEKDPARRPRSAADLLEALEKTAGPSGAGAPRRPGALFAAGIGAAVVAAAGVLYLTLRVPSHTEPLTISAFPFLNVSRDTALDYLSDGISDEVLTAVGKLPDVEIIGRNAAYRYKGRGDVDPRTVSRELGVRFVITGTLREAAGRITISAQLNDSVSHGELWAETFVRDRADFGSVTDDIVRMLTDTLQVRFPRTLGERPRVASAGTTNSAALDAYLVGQELRKRRGAGIEQSVVNFRKAIVLDPDFARAHAALAMAFTFYPYYFGTSPAALTDSITGEARRALALDPSLADAHVAMASVYGWAAEWKSMETELQQAVTLEPDNLEAHHAWVRFMVSRGMLPEAISHLRQARRIERVSPLVSAWFGYTYFLEGKLDSAVGECERALELDPTLLPTLNFASETYLALGRLDDARHVFSATPMMMGMTTAPYVFTRLGDTATANRIVRHMQTAQPRPWYVDQEEATVALAIGDTSSALTALERSARTTGAGMWVIPLPDPAFDPVRRSARFAALLRAGHFDVPLLTAPRHRRHS